MAAALTVHVSPAHLDYGIISTSHNPGALLVEQHTKHWKTVPPECCMVPVPRCRCAQRQPPATAGPAPAALTQQQLLC